MPGRLIRLAIVAGGAGAAARVLRKRQRTSAPAVQPLSAQPDRLPNEPQRPAGTTPAPTGRATPDGGAPPAA